MNNYRYIVTHDLKEVARFLCDLQEENKGCNCCPVQPECSPGMNGWINFLRSEHGGEYGKSSN